MRFSRVAFNRHLGNIGQKVLWRASYACPCLNPTSGSPDPRCPKCLGLGCIWDDGIETVVGVASQKSQVNWARFGMYQVGDLVLSVPENSVMWDRGGQFDRVTMKNGMMKFSEVLTRGAPTEKMRVQPVKITRCFWRNPRDPKELIEVGIPTVGSDRVPVWGENAPPMRVAYSLTGEIYNEYFMIDGLPSVRNEHTGMRLPKNIVLRKWDLWGRQARTAS